LEAGECTQQRGLAHAVDTQQACDLTGKEPGTDVGYHCTHVMPTAIADRKIPKYDRCLFHAHKGTQFQGNEKEKALQTARSSAGL